MKNRYRKYIPSFVYLLIAILFFIQTFFIKEQSGGMISRMNSKIFPRVIILCLAAISIISAIKAHNTDEEIPPFITNKKQFYLSVLCMVGTLLLINYTGMILAGWFYLFSEILLLSDKEKNKKYILKICLISLGVSVSLCLLFKFGFSMRLPLFFKIL